MTLPLQKNANSFPWLFALTHPWKVRIGRRFVIPFPPVPFRYMKLYTWGYVVVYG